VIDADGTQLAANDNWREAPNAARIESTGLQPLDDREAAVLLSLSTGGYTVIVQGKLNGTGTALVEAYQLD
jgi:hypothetical protein